jgi:hypothetical protein
MNERTRLKLKNAEIAVAITQLEDIIDKGTFDLVPVDIFDGVLDELEEIRDGIAHLPEVLNDYQHDREEVAGDGEDEQVETEQAAAPTSPSNEVVAMQSFIGQTLFGGPAEMVRSEDAISFRPVDETPTEGVLAGFGDTIQSGDWFALEPKSKRRKRKIYKLWRYKINGPNSVTCWAYTLDGSTSTFNANHFFRLNRQDYQTQQPRSAASSPAFERGPETPVEQPAEPVVSPETPAETPYELPAGPETPENPT